MIEEYFFDVERAIQEFPDVVSVTLKKRIYNIKQGYISSVIMFNDGGRLEFAEVKDADVKSKIKYRYQYMDNGQNMMFRYDNAPHHPEVSTFPHHLHKGDEVNGCIEPSIGEILLTISGMLRTKSQGG